MVQGERMGLQFLCNALTSEVWGMWWEAGTQPAELALIHTVSLCWDPLAKKEMHCASPNIARCDEAVDSGF